MPIQVKFFASLREQLDCGERTLDADVAKTVADVWAAATEGRPLAEHILMAVNMEYVQAQAPVSDGDEVAFFPPVTGG